MSGRKLPNLKTNYENDDPSYHPSSSSDSSSQNLQLRRNPRRGGVDGISQHESDSSESENSEVISVLSSSTDESFQSPSLDVPIQSSSSDDLIQHKNDPAIILTTQTED